MDRAFVVAAIIVAWASPVPRGPATAFGQDAEPAAPKFSADRIDQMVAPVALRPDSLLAQMFIASTYPLERRLGARCRDRYRSPRTADRCRHARPGPTARLPAPAGGNRGKGEGERLILGAPLTFDAHPDYRLHARDASNLSAASGRGGPASA
jgi:hypothetical protein